MSLESHIRDNQTQSIIKIYNLRILKLLIDLLKQMQY
jgi:hypothetical protein